MTTRQFAAPLALAVSLSLALTAFGQDKPATKDGPIIKDYGAVYPVPDADFKPSPIHVFKVVFSVADSPKSPSDLNPGINTVARFLNMQAQAGVPLKNMHLALVLHGAAGKDALNDAAYQARYQTDNPNLPLLIALRGAGVDIYLCGQTAGARGFPKAALAPGVKLALSAMTVITTLEARGYVLVP
jgi:intracellular sulfur oxidation DsrE/DsrF family protein